jgi:hypothetical protein
MKILGQDTTTVKNQLVAVTLNIYSWLLSFIPWRNANQVKITSNDKNRCVAIPGPGGLDKLQLIAIPGDEKCLRATVGYNVPMFKAPYASIVTPSDKLADLVLVRNSYFSINYADICIRWG